MNPESIQEQARLLAPEIIAIRRHLHAHPELSYQEVETGKFISRTLTGWGIEHETGWADNGIVVNIRGEQAGEKVFALRGDIDALPILEENEVSYKSKHDGVMHACGHDVHTSCLLGAVKILHASRAHFGGTIRAIFQPAEEVAPGGASILIKEGVLEDPTPAGIVGQHVHPPLEAGKVGMRPGIYMASTDELFLTVRGRGGHGALPQTTVDPIVISAHLITALQTIISRNADPTTPTVLTFGSIQSKGGTNNVIPDEVYLKGTFRAMNEDWRREAKQRMQELVSGLAASMGGSAELRIKDGYPFLHNDEALTARVRQLAVDYLGEDRVVDLPIRMTGEDFAYYSHQIPGCFYRLGIRNEARGITHGLHTSRFDVDESAIEVGVGMMAWLGLSALRDAD